MSEKMMNVYEFHKETIGRLLVGTNWTFDYKGCKHDTEVVLRDLTDAYKEDVLSKTKTDTCHCGGDCPAESGEIVLDEDACTVTDKRDGGCDIVDAPGIERFDEVGFPTHYCEGRRYEPRLVAEDWGLINSGYLYDALAYLSRIDRKGTPEDSIRDLRKAIQNLRFEMERREKGMRRCPCTRCCSPAGSAGRTCPSGDASWTTTPMRSC